jgi:hypothetical protein
MQMQIYALSKRGTVLFFLGFLITVALSIALGSAGKCHVRYVAAGGSSVRHPSVRTDDAGLEKPKVKVLATHVLPTGALFFRSAHAVDSSAEHIEYQPFEAERSECSDSTG